MTDRLHPVYINLLDTGRRAAAAEGLAGHAAEAFANDSAAEAFAENRRIAAIVDIRNEQPRGFHRDIFNAAIGDGKTTAAEVALQVMAAEKHLRVAPN